MFLLPHLDALVHVHLQLPLERLHFDGLLLHQRRLGSQDLLLAVLLPGLALLFFQRVGLGLDVVRRFVILLFREVLLDLA